MSCRKDNGQKDELDIYPARDMVLVQGALTDAFSIVDKVGKSEPGLRDNYGLPMCATVVFQDTLQFPYSFTIDFGETNCEDDFGILRRGKIHVKTTGPYLADETVITTSLENYFLMNHQLRGERVVTNLGENEYGNLHYSVVESAVSLTNPDEQWVTNWESNLNRQWISGVSTAWDPYDDEFSITGDANGVSRLGTPYIIDVVKPLVVSLSCPFIVKGVLDILPQKSIVLEVDYGAGNCNEMATVTVNGNEYDLSLQ